MEKNQHLGKTIYFNEAADSYTKTGWKNKLIPAIEKMASAYTLLGVGKFDQNVYDRVTTQGVAGIEKEYKEAIASDINKFKKQFKSLTSVIVEINTDTEQMNDFKKAVEDFNQTYYTMNSFMNYYDSFDLSDCKIYNEKPALDEQKITSRNTVVLDTEEKAKFYELVLNAIEAFNKIREFEQTTKAKDDPTPLISVAGIPGLNKGVMMEDESGIMQLVPENFEDLDL